jgi:hypothetical protein
VIQPVVEQQDGVAEDLKLDAEAARRNSPRYREPATKTPLLLAVGELESAGFPWQSWGLAGIWRDFGVPITPR